jgi:LVIVD repeat-containing protein
VNWRLLATLMAAWAVAACDGSDGNGGIEPPDTTPPVLLSVVGQGVVSERFTSEVAVAGDWVYTGTWSSRQTVGNALKIWNASSGTPVLVDSIIIPNAKTIGDVQISQDGSLLVVPAEYRSLADGIYIYDRSNPARPTLLSQFVTTSTQGGVHTVKLGIVGARHYAFLSINPTTVPAHLVIVDITNPANPTQVFERIMGAPYVHDVFVRDGLLFTALWDDGMTIWDIGGGGRGGTPANPVQLGNVRTVDGNAHNIHWVHDPTNNSKRYAFVGQEEQILNGPPAGDIHVVDVSNLAAPREVAFFRVPGAGVHNFAVDEPSGILYAAFYNGGVRALNVRGDLGNCAATARAPDGRCDLALMGRERGRALTDRPVSVWGVALQGTALYASDMPNGVWRLDAAPLQR